MAETTGNSSQPFVDAYIKEPSILAEKVLSNSLISGMLTLPVKEEGTYKTYTVPFYLENEFSFSLGNNWNQLVDTSMTSALNSLYNLGASAFNQGTQVTFQSKYLSAASWNGSEIPKFSLSLTFVATRRSINPASIIRALAGTCLPNDIKDSQVSEATQKFIEGTASNVENIGQSITDVTGWSSASTGARTIANGIRHAGIAAPLNYGLISDDSTGNALVPMENTTLTLQIGQWFVADNLIVESLSNIQLSKEVVAPPLNYDTANTQYERNNSIYGFPLYAKCSLILRPYTYITYDEFYEYFTFGQIGQEEQNLKIDTNQYRGMGDRIG